jgi:hypothetical protein
MRISRRIAGMMAAAAFGLGALTAIGAQASINAADQPTTAVEQDSTAMGGVKPLRTKEE